MNLIASSAIRIIATLAATLFHSDQTDFLTATKFVNQLIGAGVEVERAKQDFQIGVNHYPAGSCVVRSAQAFRAHVLDMFEPQDHPNDFAYPRRAAHAALRYRWTGRWPGKWPSSLTALQDAFTLDKSAFEELTAAVPPPHGSVGKGETAAGFLLVGRVNDSFRAVNRLLAAAQEGAAVHGRHRDHSSPALSSSRASPRRRHCWKKSPANWERALTTCLMIRAPEPSR